MKKLSTLILIGGGHTHALLLKKIILDPLKPVRIVLISAPRFTPYSGMLPGVIAGIYTPQQAHIDLKKLADLAGCSFIEASVIKLDTERQVVELSNGESEYYDWLSINTGSTQSRIVDAPHCISIKPIHHFLPWLNTVLTKRLEHKSSSFNLVIIGAGAAGVETVLALRKRFPQPHIKLHLISGSHLLKGYPSDVQRSMIGELNQKKVEYHADFQVANIEENRLVSNRGEQLEYHQLILATSAASAKWPAESDLSTDKNGFILVNDQLQPINHSNIFAVGDIASFRSSPVAKSGVYAVRQAPFLHKNIQSCLTGQPMTTYHPQQRFLSLLSCSDGRAMASKGWFQAKGRWVWFWKDYIDRKFMAQFPQPEAGFLTETPDDL